VSKLYAIAALLTRQIDLVSGRGRGKRANYNKGEKMQAQEFIFKNGRLERFVDHWELDLYPFNLRARDIRYWCLSRMNDNRRNMLWNKLPRYIRQDYRKYVIQMANRRIMRQKQESVESDKT
jgi:hypothetical protein